MIALTPHDTTALSGIVAAGDDGREVDGVLGLSTAIRLEGHGLTIVRINGNKVRAFSTPAGRAFAYRVAS